MNKQSLRSKDLKPKANCAYVCEGSCHAKITQDQYEKGLTKCGTKSCNFFGKPFKKLDYPLRLK